MRTLTASPELDSQSQAARSMEDHKQRRKPFATRHVADCDRIGSNSRRSVSRPGGRAVDFSGAGPYPKPARPVVRSSAYFFRGGLDLRGCARNGERREADAFASLEMRAMEGIEASANSETPPPAGRCIECGAEFPARRPNGGQRRRFCSDRCRRREDHRRRKIRVRLETLDMWRALKDASGHPYSRAFVTMMIAELEAEVFVLEHQGYRSAS